MSDPTNTPDEPRKYRHDQRLLVHCNRVEYRVGIVALTGWRALPTLGKIASVYRKLGPDFVKKELPDLPQDIMDGILLIAADQDRYVAEQRAAEASSPEEQQRADAVGRWLNHSW